MSKITKRLVAFMLSVGLVFTGAIGVYADGLDDLGSVVDGSSTVSG